MLKQMEINVLCNGKQICAHNGRMLNRDGRRNRLNRALALESPGKITVNIFSFVSDRANKIYSGEIQEREMYWNGRYCKNR